jgi:predicted membrane protein
MRLAVETDPHKADYDMRQRGHSADCSNGIFSARFAIGVAIIALGALFLFDSFGWIESRYVLRQAWPLIFVVIGISILSKRREGRRRKEGWAFIVVGLWIFLSKIGLLDLSLWGILFPLVLLFVGGMLVYRSLSPPRPSVSFDPIDAPKQNASPDAAAGSAFTSGTSYARDEEHAEYIRTFSMLSGSELRPMSRPFRGADLSAVLGGVNLDLTSARMEGDVARIDVFAFCGGIEIHVPPDWTVTSKVATLLGGFSDKRRPTTTLPTKTLIIDGFAIMGGIEVKN